MLLLMAIVLTTFIELIKTVTINGGNHHRRTFTAEFEQIVNCVVHGEWDITHDTRKRLFSFKNIKDIINAFNNHLK